MTSQDCMLERYISGEYWTQHPNWHLEDSLGKAEDLLPALLAVVDDAALPSIKIADVGAGVGGVLVEAVKRIQANRPNIRIVATAIEPSQQAAEESKRRFPELTTLCKPLEPTDGPFTALMFVDVLEHLENPWEMLRVAHSASEYLVVRQPLIESFSTFRARAYKRQRDEWGHISYFNYHSFLDMAAATGWKPLRVDVVAPWELKIPPNPRIKQRPFRSFIRRAVLNINRVMSSYFMTGFYLNGAFKRI